MSGESAMGTKGGGSGPERSGRLEIQGIVVTDGTSGRESAPEPRIAAFIWGTERATAPTLPFGRWKGPA